MLGRLTNDELAVLSSLKSNLRLVSFLETKLKESDKRLRTLRGEDLYVEQGQARLLEELLNYVNDSSKFISERKISRRDPET